MDAMTLLALLAGLLVGAVGLLLLVFVTWRFVQRRRAGDTSLRSFRQWCSDVLGILWGF